VLHKAGGEVCVFSRNCKNLTDRFPSIRDAVLSLPARSAVIDGELVACDTDGMPNFFALMCRRTDGLCVRGFDLLELNGRDLRTRPLATRKDKLRDILIAAATTRCVSRRASRIRRSF
jgi:bifunctional non-homologous end joining protein LigD